MQNINQSANAGGLSSAGAVPCNLEKSKDELITTLQVALRQCRQAVEDGSRSPSARLELVRDYATPALVEAERCAMAEWRRFWHAQAPDMEPASLEAAAQAMAVAEKVGIIPAQVLARLRAKVSRLKWTEIPAGKEAAK